MNKIHSKVWNKELGQLVVASEFATSDSAGVVQGAAGPMRRSLLALVLAPLLALAAPAALAQEWNATVGADTAAIGDGGTVTFEGGANINVALTGGDDNATVEVALDPDLVVDSVTADEVTTGQTVMNNTGVAVGANVELSAAGLVVGGVSVTADGINAGNRVITNVLDGTAAHHAVNRGQLDGVATAAQSAADDNAAAIDANTTEIGAVRTIAETGWNVSAEGGTPGNVAPGATVDFSGDGNIEVARTGTNLTFSLADEIEVQSITAGSAAFGSDGLTIDGGPSVTSGGIDAGGLAITNMAPGEVADGSTEAITGGQVYNYFIEEGASGVRYFRAASAAPDSAAEGAESIAIGPNTVSNGDSSLAAGDGAETTEEGEAAIALGQGAIAGGAEPNSGGAGAIAIGRNSGAGGTGAVALGDGASATAGNATALGAGAEAAGGSSIAIGGASAMSGDSFAAGRGAFADSPGAIALGTGAGAGTYGTEANDRTHHIAIGTGAGQNVVGNQTTAIGFQAGSDVGGLHNVAVGSHAGANLQGNYNVSIGHEANRNAGSLHNATAIGGQSDAARDGAAVGYGAQAGDASVAVGSQASAGDGGVALGRNAEAEGSHVALGIGSAARSSDAQGAGYLTGSDFTDGQVVSVGNSSLGGEQRTRRIVNVADGSQAYDAVNVRQLQEAQDSVATLVGGGVTRNADGSYSPIVVDVAGGGTAEFATIVEAIGAVTDGTVDILPVDAVRFNAEGGISNVAAGTAATDAVNVQQLNEAVAESGVKYFSVNSEIIANRNNASASGMDAMAVGPAASAGGRSSLAAGHLSHTVGSESVALGYEVEALGDNSTVVGSSSIAYHDGGVAIGREAESHGENSIVMGTRAHSHPKNTDETVDNAIVIGTDAEVTADNGIAVGQSALASELRAVAQGYDAHAVADDAMAFGSNSRASGASSQASGTGAHASGVNAQARGTAASASGYNAIASGTGATGYARDGIAMGTGAVSGFDDPNNTDPHRNTGGIAIGDSALADNHHALALGVDASAEAESATAIGDSAEATGEDALAIGSDASASAQDALAMGTGARTTGQGASAIGQGAEAVAQDALAFGTGARASQQNAMALGQGAQAMHADSVALGSGALTAAAVGTESHTVDKNTYAFAGTEPVATVSVGSAGQERTITNVAAGRISADSTDAINGSQLYGTNQAVDALGNDLDTAGGSVAAALGGGSTYDAETHTVSASLSVRGNTYTNVQEALTHVGQGWDVSADGSAGANVAPGGAVDFGNTDGNIDIVRPDGTTDLVFDLNDELTIGESISFADGPTLIDGDSVTTTNLRVAGETRLGDQFVVNNDNTVTYNGQEIANQSDGLSFAGNTGGTISKTLGDDTPLAIEGALDESESASGANLRVDSDGSQLNLRMARDLTDLNSITINNGGPVIGSGGIDMNDNRITNLAPGVEGTDAVNLEQLEDVEAIANRGWDLSVENGEERTVAPGSEVNVRSSDGNIDIARPAGTTDLEFALADDLEIGNSIGFADGDTIIDGDSVSTTNLTVEGDTLLGDHFTVNEGGVYYDGPITEGDHIVNKTYVDGQVGDLANTPLTFAGDAGTNVDRLLGETVNLVGGAADEATLTDGNIGVVADGDATLAIRLNKDIDLGEDGSVEIGDAELDNDGLAVDDGAGNRTTVGADGTTVDDGAGNTTTVAATGTTVTDGTATTTVEAGVVTVAGGTRTIVIDGDAGTIGGLANQDIDYEDFADGSGRAATEEQLSQVNEIANAGWNLSADGDNATNVGPGDTVDLSNTDGNIVVAKADDSNDVTFDLADDLEIGNSISFVDSDTVIDGDSVTTTNLTVAGDTVLGDHFTVNEGGVYYDGPITDGDHIVNKDYVDGQVGDLAGTPLTFAGDAGTNVDRLLGETVNLVGGATDEAALTDGNIGVVADGDDTLAIRLNKDIDLGEDGSVAIGDAELDTEGLAVDDGAGNRTTVGADGTTVDDGSGNTTTVAATGTTVTGDNASTTVEAGVVTVTANPATGPQNTIIIDANAGTIGGLANQDIDYEDFADGSGRAATEEQLSQVNATANAGWTLTDTDGNDVNIGPNGVVTFEGDDNISVTQTGEDQDGVIAITLDRDLDVDSVTAGNAMLDTEGLVVDDGTGNRTAIGAGTVTVTANPLTGPQNIITIDANTGTISGLANQDIDYDDFADGSGRAATEEQLSQVNATANAGWTLTDTEGNDVNIGPNGVVTFEGDDNIAVTQTGDDQDGVIAITLDRDLDLDSVRMGDTFIDTTGVAIGADVHLGSAGLVITGGPRVTTEGIHAGDMVITGVAPGEISASSTEAINGSQLYGMGDSIVTVIGGNVELNPDGTITTRNIGGTGHDNIDDAIRAANDAANAGWTATDADGNDANIGPNGTVSFTGDDNISVTQAGADQSGEIQITLDRDLDVDSITAGNTVIDTDGVRVGDDVHLGDTGLVIEGGPSVTKDGIDAGGNVISNVAAGVEDTDAVNVGQLNQVAGDVTDLGDRMDVVEGDVADLQGGAAGPFQVSQEAPLVPPTPTGENSAAGGSGADASGDNSTALGNQAVASGANSTAVGQGAEATHDNSVALGQGSATTVGAQTGYDAAYVGSSNSSGEVNVGNRTITGVAPGVAGTDAVNVDQLNAGVNHAVVTANAYTDQRFNQVQSDVWQLHGRVDELERDINAGVATAMALRQAPYVAGATTYYAGFGAYKDQGALGVSLRRTADNGRWSLEGGFSANRDGAGGYIGVSGVLGGK